MNFEYQGGGEQLLVYRDGGYRAVPAEDLSAEDAAALEVTDDELLQSGLYAPANLPAPHPLPVQAPELTQAPQPAEPAQEEVIDDPAE